MLLSKLSIGIECIDIVKEMGYNNENNSIILNSAIKNGLKIKEFAIKNLAINKKIN